MPFPTDVRWRLETVRLSLFLADSPIDLGAGWWAQVTGVEPEESTSKRAIGEYVDAGPFEGARLWLGRNVLAKRADWIIHPSPSMGDDFPAIGEFAEWRDKFFGLMDGWLATTDLSVTRVALGATIVCSVPDRDAGYTFLRNALPMITFEDDWSDFSFQVTKKIDCSAFSGSPLAESSLNCLSKWNSVTLNVMSTDQLMDRIPSLYAGKIELDLNTPASNKEVIGVSKVREILSVLVETATRYTREGFIK